MGNMNMEKRLNTLNNQTINYYLIYWKTLNSLTADMNYPQINKLFDK